MLIRGTLIALAMTTAFGAVLAFDARSAAATEPYRRGIDVSHWQAKPNWTEAKASGVEFVIAKASSNNAGRDPEYIRNRTRLRRLSIPFTAYHYARPDSGVGDAVIEADNFVDAAGLNGRNLLPVLDLESYGDLSPEQLIEWVATWMNRVEERLGVKAMIYTNAAFWVERMGDTRWFADNGYRLWIRHWYVETPDVPAENWGGHGWTIWQHGKAPVPGIRSTVDQNYFNGTSFAPLRIKNNR
jgi:lysozyme